MKGYVGYSIKNKLPLHIVVFSLFLIFTIVFVSQASFIKSVPSNYYYSYDPVSYSVEGGYIGLIVCFFLIITFLPFFSVNYRYSVSKSDTFKQVATSDKTFRYIDHGLTLGITLASFSIVFLLMVMMLLVKNNAAVIPSDTAHTRYYKIYYEYAPFLYMYVQCLLFGFMQYAISYFFISRSNNFVNSLIMLVFGEFFLATFGCLISKMCNEDYFFLFGPCANASFLFPMSYIDCRFHYWIVDANASFSDGLYRMTSSRFEEVYLYIVLSFVLFFSVALLGILAFFLEKDPSSEWAGKPETQKPYQEIIYHLSFGTIGTLIGWYLFESFSPGVIVFIPLYLVVYAVLYYTLYGLLRKNFKLKGYQVAIMIVNIAASFTISLLGVMIIAALSTTGF